MKVSIDKILPNPFRDFELDPILPEQVARLLISHKQIGQFGAVPVRPHPTQKGYYEQASGHHNIVAMRERGAREINVEARERTDDEMVRLLALENLTQRQHNAGAQADAVAARAKLVAWSVLSAIKYPNSSVGVFDGHDDERAYAKVLEYGPGEELLYTGLNGFPYSPKVELPDGVRQIISMRDIRAQVGNLKANGKMSKLMADVLAQVQIIREQERLAREEQERREAEKREKAEAEHRAREAERIRKAEAEEERKRQAAVMAEERAKREKDEKAKREAERVRKEADEATRKAEAARVAVENQRKARNDAAKAEAKAREKSDQKRAAREYREHEARAREEQKALNAIYDVRCSSVFDWPQQEQAFREVVLSDNGRRFIPKAKQYDLAKSIQDEIVIIEKKRGMKLGSPTVKQMVMDALANVMGIQRDLDEREKRELLKANAVRRVNERWATFRRGLAQAASALSNIADDEKTWRYEKELFPIDQDALRIARLLSDEISRLSKAVGG